MLTNNIIKFLKIGEASKYFFISILGPYADLDLSINVDTKTQPAHETDPLVDKLLLPILHRISPVSYFSEIHASI